MSENLKRLRDSPRVGEVVGLILAVLGLVTLLALLSYEGDDVTWFSHGARDAPHRNWLGPFGAMLAESLLQVLGVAAFLAPFFFGILGWHLLRRDPQRVAKGRLLGQLALAVALCSLLDLLYGAVRYDGEAFPAGGYVGKAAAGWLRSWLNGFGAVLLSTTVLAGIVILTTRVSVARCTQLAVGRTRRTWRQAAERLREIRKRRADEAVAAPPPSIRLQPERPSPAGPTRPEPALPPAARRTIKPAAVRPKQTSLPMEPGSKGYALPGPELFNDPEPQSIESEQELLDRARLITDKFQEFAVNGSVVAIHPGPVVTTFEFKPEAGIKYSKITGMTDDLSLALKAESVRIDRMAGRATVGIEVPNRRQETIFPRELFSSDQFRNSTSTLTLALGKDISGEVFTADLDRMPHLLIAGATGSGKSVGLNCMIASLLLKATPDRVRFIMIDTKMIELGIYANIPHLLIPVVTDAKHASTALKWAAREMERRYRRLAFLGVRNISQFNAALKEKPGTTMEDPKGGEPIALETLPYIVIVIDELADLMMISSSDVEESIMRLAQMARAVGIHLIIATQRPSVDVITGTIKANFPSRIAFRVSQRVDSRTIIDQQGAEHLLGRGDMLYLPSDSSRLLRLHGGFITEAELNRITSFLKKMAGPVYDESVLKEDEGEPGSSAEGQRDEMYLQAVRTVIQEGKCSITLIQRRLQLGYARAARIVDMMERDGVVSLGEGSKPREVLVGADFLESNEAPP